MTVVSPADRKADTRSLRRSPLADRAAELRDRSARDVQLAEEPFLTQVNLRVHPGSPAVARIEHALDLALPHHEPNTVSGDETEAALWLGPDEWLLVGPDGRAASLVAAVTEALADSLGSCVDVSANRTTVRLSGPRSRDVLEKVCSLDLHPRSFGPGRCAQTLVGRAQVVLWQVTREPAYRLLVRGSYAAYLADLLLDAADEFTTE
ncbi:sarcosine oxidase subunit gamma family protein [Saccharopolyspora hordei]|uniref:Sarcosine oxidase subunit gamma n=1 Tax=Saccharopolyspora hordei TaxID=1838 RepID=A0A853AI95_9PSEU|nr:sarcosine oxidase subunit gamma [Saccharopolyspora hordei]